MSENQKLTGFGFLCGESTKKTQAVVWANAVSSPLNRQSINSERLLSESVKRRYLQEPPSAGALQACRSSGGDTSNLSAQQEQVAVFIYLFLTIV